MRTFSSIADRSNTIIASFDFFERMMSNQENFQ
jgi:hypothetical protein